MPAGARDDVQYGGGAGRTGQMPGPGVPDKPTLLWRTNVAGAVDATPIVANGQVIVGANDGRLYVLDLNTGAVVWTFQTGGSIKRAAAVADGTILVASSDHILHAIDTASRKERWQFGQASTDDIPSVVDGLVIVGSLDHAVVALDAATGVEHWRVAVAGTGRMSTVAEGVAYLVGDGDGSVYAVAVDSGALLWSYQTGANTVQVPAVSGGTVFASAQDAPGRFAKVVALDAATGAERWSYTTAGAEQLGKVAVDGARVYTETWADEPSAVALDRATGVLIWQTPIAGTGSPVLAGDLVYESSGSGGVIEALDVATGATRWTYATGPTDGVSDLAITKGIIIYTTGIDAHGHGSVGALVSAGDPRLGSTPSPAASAAGAALPSGSAVPQPVRYVTEFQADSIVSLYLNVRLDPAGNVWVMDQQNDRILEFDPDGVLVRTLGTHGQAPGQFDFSPAARNGDQAGSIAFAPDGWFVVGDGNNHRVQRFDASGKPLGQFGRFGRDAGQFINPCCVGVDSHGQIYVADPERNDIQVFSPTGEYIRKFGRAGTGPGEFYLPGPPTFDSADNTYVPDNGNSKVDKFDSKGSFVSSFAGDPSQNVFLGGVQFVVVDGHGRMIIADDANGIVIMDQKGKVLALIGKSVDGHDAIYAVSLALSPGGRLYVATVGHNGGPDSFNRVTVLQLQAPLWP